MSAIPIRPNAPWGPRTAPRPGLPGLSGGFAAWRPTALTRAANGLKIPKIPLRTFGVSGMISAYVAGLVAREAITHLTLYMNGLQFVRFCAPLGSDGFQMSTSLAACYTGQGSPGQPISQIGAVVAGLPGFMSGPRYFHLMGFSGFAAGAQPRYGEQSTYMATSMPGVTTRPRPFYQPIALPTARSVYAPYYPPGRVPRTVTPWPVWGRPRPLDWPANPSPTADPPDYAGSSETPGRKWEYAFPPSGAGSLPRVSPISRVDGRVRSPAVPGEQETKIGANTAAGQLFMGLMRAREGVSEMRDMVKVLFKSLPKETQAAYGGKGATDAQMLEALATNWGKIDGQLFLFNLLSNQIEDEIIGRSYMKGRSEQNKAAGILGSNGPVGNSFFQEYAKRVSSLSEAVAGVIMGGEENLTYSQERSLAYRIGKAEDAYQRWLHSED